MSGAVRAVETVTHARIIAVEAGWRVFPIRPRTKRPYVEHGSKEATTDLATIEAWWRRWPYASIGAIVPDHLVAVDLDPRNGCELSPDTLATTLCVATGGGGWHLYYRRPPGVELAAHCEAFPGVDLIRPGRQTILPPTIHPSGEKYRWLNRATPVELPWRLTDAFARRVHAPRSWGGTRIASERYLDAARAGIVAHLATDAVPGNRHNALNAAAFRYWQLGLDVEDALEDLWPVIPFAPDFTEAEARRTIESVWR